ncbi:MAG: ATP-dependent sacrificial sulfur transferase LarE [Nitrospina sp.]|jgi:pyridinium-3,5-biscarboxylic acid mononucleotide sulfurtransferase|nr:ATP-dependent sacrificial sulfur transferase LarE [Nitrospina sp.]MBT6600045.1 ATP-dependent sacrificial sulfur transferase LarE [Nitrospina sp.]
MLLQDKRLNLESKIFKLDSAIVAFSGGIDSTLVLAVANKVLSGRVLAVTAKSDSVPERELHSAQELTKALGINHKIIRTEEMSSPNYLKNPENRCYYCKLELYAKLAIVSSQYKITSILNGINLDDLGDHRPGIIAAKEASIISPLVDSQLNKQDVRNLARDMGLTNWEKPALACLSSRIPYGQPVTSKKLSMINKAEEVFLAEGFKEVRVRHYGDMARIELLKTEIPNLMKNGLYEKTINHLKKIGFHKITIDPEGYRSGSLNEALDLNSKPTLEESKCGK